MKYKVGDKVKVKEGLIFDKRYGICGFVYDMKKYKTLIIKSIEYCTEGKYYKVKENNWNWTDEMLEPYQFTKSDLKDNHIVIYRGGSKVLWAKVCDMGNYREDLSHIIDTCSIDEVWEFNKLVWKREEKPIEILDEGEKKWLRNFIRITNIRDKINRIKLCEAILSNPTNSYIYIKLLDGSYTKLPDFKTGTMYKGMKVGKEYTLKDLGLDKEEK